MSEHLAAGWAIFRRDLQIFLSYPSLAFSQAISVIVSVALFYYVSKLIRVPAFESPDSYFAFVIVGLVIVSVIQSTLTLPAGLRSELVAGTFERILLSPFGPVRGVLSMMIFPVVLALVMSVWTIGVAAALFGLELDWSTAPLTLPVGLLAAMSFSAIALLVAAVVVVFKQAPGIGMVIAGVGLISGVYFPTDLLPSWIEWMSKVQPFTPSVDLMRHFLVGLPMSGSISVAVLKLIGFAVVLLPLAAWLLGRGVLAAQRRGTIIEY
jgi:ABC-2 type transport system permease protein